MRSERLRVGVIGVGSIGQNHARIYSCLPDVELVGVCDTDYAKAIDVAKRFGGDPFQKLDDFLELGLEAVSVAVPASKHQEVVSLCAEAGCHILLEKPLAHNLEDAKKIIMNCDLNNVRLMVGHVERFNPVVLTVKECMASDDVISIDIERVGPKPPRIKDVGVIKDLGVHDIDLLRYLTGKEILHMYSLVAGEGDIEDIGMLSFQLEDEILAHITVNWITPFKVRRIQVAGLNGFIEGDLLNRKVKYFKKTRGKNYITEEIPVSQEEPLEKELKTFIKCLMFGTDFPISVDDAYRALEIAELSLNKPGELLTLSSPAKKEF